MNFSQSPTKLDVKVKSRVIVQNHESICANEHNSIFPFCALFIYLLFNERRHNLFYNSVNNKIAGKHSYIFAQQYSANNKLRVSAQSVIM